MSEVQCPQGSDPKLPPSNGETKTQEWVLLGAVFTQLFSINQRQGDAVEEVGTEKTSCGKKKGLKRGAGIYLEGPLRILGLPRWLRG